MSKIITHLFGVKQLSTAGNMLNSSVDAQPDTKKELPNIRQFFFCVKFSD